MIYKKIARRHFLQGAGGFAIAAPFLPSLMDRADAASLPRPRFFVAKWNGHGGLHPDNLYPIRSTIESELQTQVIYPASGQDPQHSVAYANLRDLAITHQSSRPARASHIRDSVDLDSGSARVSPILGSYLTPSILDDINLVQGVDLPIYAGHNRGAFGNFAERDGGAYGNMSRVPIPTIDYVIGNSSKFYTAADVAPRAPSYFFKIHEMSGRNISMYPNGTGLRENPYSSLTSDIHKMYDDLLAPRQGEGQGTADPNAALVDLVFEDFSRLARGAFGEGRRIGADDRARLEQYMQGLSDIASRMRNFPLACTVPPRPAYSSSTRIRDGQLDGWSGSAISVTDTEQRAAFELHNMLIVQAFLCGRTRVLVHTLPDLKHQYIVGEFTSTEIVDGRARTDPHGTVFHNHKISDRQQYILEAQRFIIRYGFIDLVERLKGASLVTGTSLLDQSVVYFTQESGGRATHDSDGLPCLMAGKGGGFFRTGMYVDVRNMNRPVSWNDISNRQDPFYAGLPQNRILASICQAMGLAPADYELNDTNFHTKFPNRGGKVPGYGDPWQDPGFVRTVPNPDGSRGPWLTNPIINDMSVPFPVIYDPSYTG